VVVKINNAIPFVKEKENTISLINQKDVLFDNFKILGIIIMT
jgi:hypothetical protein